MTITVSYLSHRPLIIIAALLFGLVGAIERTHADQPMGIVKEQPKTGQYVQVKNGFMVPYTVKIPGTEASLTMIPIAGGTFKMGSPDSEADRNDNEGPQLDVSVEPFWIGQYEITWDQYDPYLETYHAITQQSTQLPKDQWADAVSLPTPLYDLEAIPIIRKMGRKGGYPAASMHQFNARHYTKWLSKKTSQFYRLPSSVEWEYAARAGTTTAFSFGNDAEQLDGHGWFFDNSEWPGEANRDIIAGYRQVGQKKPNPWGLYDMHGNVGEWVLDAYDEDRYSQLKKKAANQSGPLKASELINWGNEPDTYELRGGHWDSDAVECRSAFRTGSTSEWSEHDPQIPRSIWFLTEFWVGFRVVRPYTAPATDADKGRYWEADSQHKRTILLDTKQRRAVIQP